MNGRRFFAAVSADASGCEVVKAAPAAGSIVVDHLKVNSDAELTVTIGAGEADSAVVTALIGSLPLPVQTAMTG